MHELTKLGWHPELEAAAEPYRQQGFDVGRIAIENRDNYLLLTASGEFQAHVTGKLLFQSENPSELPKVGDWVVVSLFEDEGKAIIHEILPRKTTFSRKVAGSKTDEQVVAANIDTTFIVQSLDHDFNLRRLERYLVMIYESRIQPAIILNKVDLCDTPEAKITEVEALAKEAPIFAISATTLTGMDKLQNFLESGRTYAFIGSSGVGKSTVINKLMGTDLLKTRDVRTKDSKGRHTTTRRELVALPSGALVIDTPGMREFQLWSADEGLDSAYEEIIRLADGCRFSDCTHTSEPDCAVLRALESGDITSERYESYLKLNRELAFLGQKQDKRKYLENKRKQKELHRTIKRYYKKDK